MISEAAQRTAFPAEAMSSSREGLLVVAAVRLRALHDELASSAHPAEADQFWSPVVRAWSGHTRPWLADSFAQEVFATLQRGLVTATADGPDPDQADVVVVTPRAIPGLSGVDQEAWPESGLEPDYPGSARLAEAAN